MDCSAVLLVAVHDLPARALRQVPAEHQDEQPEHRADQKAQPPAQARVEHIEQDQRAQGAENRTQPIRSVDRDVDPAAVAGRDQLVDGGIDGRVFAADAHPGDEPGDVEERDPAGAGAEGQRGQPGPAQVHGHGDHEQLAAAQPVRQPAEEQRPDHLAEQVDGGDQTDGGRGQSERGRLGQRFGDRAGNGDLQAVEDPGDPECQHQPGVERRPGQPIEPGRNETANRLISRPGGHRDPSVTA